MKRRIISVAAIVGLTLLVMILLILSAGADPLKAVSAFGIGVFGSTTGFAETFVKATPIILVSLGVAVSFQTGFFNIGGEGQFYMGALASAFIALRATFIPGILRIIVCIIAAVLAGAIWALIPALMKTKLRISETVSTIMMNYIALMILGIVIRGPLQEEGSSFPQTAQVDKSARLLQLWMPTRLHFGIILAVVSSIAVWFIMKRSILGFEMRMAGSNQRCSACVGLPVSRSLLLAAAIGGGLAGMAGMSELLGVQYRLLEGLSSGVGYTGVLIALLAGNHPIGVLIVSLIYAFFQTGANTMQRNIGVPSAIVQIVTGVIVLLMLSQALIDKLRNRKEGARV